MKDRKAQLTRMEAIKVFSLIIKGITETTDNKWNKWDSIPIEKMIVEFEKAYGE